MVLWIWGVGLFILERSVDKAHLFGSGEQAKAFEV